MLTGSVLLVIMLLSRNLILRNIWLLPTMMIQRLLSIITHRIIFQLRIVMCCPRIILRWRIQIFRSVLFLLTDGMKITWSAFRHTGYLLNPQVPMRRGNTLLNTKNLLIHLRVVLRKHLRGVISMPRTVLLQVRNTRFILQNVTNPILILHRCSQQMQLGTLCIVTQRSITTYCRLILM